MAINFESALKVVETTPRDAKSAYADWLIESAQADFASLAATLVAGSKIEIFEMTQM